MHDMIRIELSKLLGAKRWSQTDLARATGIRPNTITDMYHDITDRVSLRQIDLICTALDCDLSDLLVRTPDDDTAAEIKHRSGTPKK